MQSLSNFAIKGPESKYGRAHASVECRDLFPVSSGHLCSLRRPASAINVELSTGKVLEHRTGFDTEHPILDRDSQKLLGIQNGKPGKIRLIVGRLGHILGSPDEISVVSDAGQIRDAMQKTVESYREHLILLENAGVDLDVRAYVAARIEAVKKLGLDLPGGEPAENNHEVYLTSFPQSCTSLHPAVLAVDILKPDGREHRPGEYCTVMVNSFGANISIIKRVGSSNISSHIYLLLANQAAVVLTSE